MSALCKMLYMWKRDRVFLFLVFLFKNEDADSARLARCAKRSSRFLFRRASFIRTRSSRESDSRVQLGRLALEDSHEPDVSFLRVSPFAL